MVEPGVIHCPLCDVPHRMAATVCDGCGQNLHAPIDIDSLLNERVMRKRHIVYASLVIVAMLALNIALFGGAAYILTTAPFGWLLWSWIRLRAMSGSLARASIRAQK